MISLKHSISELYMEELENHEDRFSEVTASLNDGKVGFHIIYLLMGSQYLRDILIETPEATRIILPDFDVITFERLIDLVKNEEAHFETSEEDISLNSLTQILYGGIDLEYFPCKHNKKKTFDKPKMITPSTGTVDPCACCFCGRVFYSLNNNLRH